MLNDFAVKATEVAGETLYTDVLALAVGKCGFDENILIFLLGANICRISDVIVRPNGGSKKYKNQWVSTAVRVTANLRVKINGKGF